MGSEDLLVGLIALAVVPLIARRILLGLREGRLPLYRTSFQRADGEAKFRVLLVLHVVSLALMTVIAADLLLDLGLRERL